MSDFEIQESERKKRYLKRYRKNVALINRLKDKVSSLDDRMIGLRSPRLSGMPRGGVPVTSQDLQAEKSEVEDRIARLESKGKRMKMEILDLIDELDDTRYAEVLESYFIDCQTIETIAEDMGYSVRHTYELYSEAIKKISLDNQ